MRRIEPHALWLAHAGDLRSPKALLDAGIRAIIDLAANEPIPPLPRDLVYCHVPLFDGAGNEPLILRLAIRTIADLLAAGIPQAVACSNGLSRSPALAAAALSIVSSTSPDDELVRIALLGNHDVSPGFWSEIVQALKTSREP